MAAIHNMQIVKSQKVKSMDEFQLLMADSREWCVHGDISRYIINL